MTKKILLTFETEQFEKLYRNHLEYMIRENETFSLQEYIRRILVKEDNKLSEVK